MKKAFLVTASLMTRVIADENATDEEIINLAKDRLKHQFENNYLDIIEEVLEDIKSPCTEEEQNTIHSFDEILTNGPYKGLTVKAVADKYPGYLLKTQKTTTEIREKLLSLVRSRCNRLLSEGQSLDDYDSYISDRRHGPSGKFTDHEASF